jgi:hypothetical protein
VNNSILLGLHRFMLRIPHPVWQQEIARSERAAKASIEFMTVEHHRVRDFVVRELPRVGKPISPGMIEQSLSLEPGVLVPILDELEEKLTFLFRNQSGSVTWAYPVTVEITPHSITFSTGEQIYAA